ncbi:MAG: hypothetical protein FJX80_05150 [Bacteroidetes bacterium]|nr:hypothetical protein [Bacteroidota bacterium]
MKRIFISKPLIEIPLLNAYCQQNRISLVAEPLITFNPIPSKIPSTLDIVFFTSPRSVYFFFDQVPAKFKCKAFACMGKGTELALNKKGLTSCFTGLFSSDPRKVFKDLKSWAGDRIITVPHSSNSLFSITNYFPEQQLNFIEVYKTSASQKTIPPVSLYIFTSPSNVKSFLTNNFIHSNAKVIAWGKSTKNYLDSREIKVSEILKSAQENELMKILVNY